MDFQITAIERYILESIQKQSNDLQAISIDTGIKEDILNSILNDLQVKSLIKVDYNKKFHINQHINQIIKDELNTPNDIYCSVQDIIMTSFETEKENFKLKKVYINEKEEKILNGLLYNLESFIQSLKKNARHTTSAKKIIFWGSANYGKTINHLINS